MLSSAGNRPRGQDVVDQTAARLKRISEFEAGLRRTPVTRVLLVVGRTKAFARFYRVIGPVIDPWILHRSKGRAASRLYGLPALVLNSVGRRSQQTRRSPLLYLRDGDDFVVVGTNFGQGAHPGWTANLLARPQAEIEVGPERLAVEAELADTATWDRLWPASWPSTPAAATTSAVPADGSRACSSCTRYPTPDSRSAPFYPIGPLLPDRPRATVVADRGAAPFSAAVFSAGWAAPAAR